MQSNPRFFSRILLPSMIAVLLFLVAIYFFVIPNYRENLMEGKRETIRELTSTAWSVMHKLDLMVSNDFGVSKAKQEAALIIGDMRWGEEMKDYFWITDTLPRMVMHPYRPSMNGMDLSNYRDQNGKNFFVDIVKLVQGQGDGYIDYKWQWKDDSLTVVSKLSYVKAYEPWGWIVGTGIYVDDVKSEIETLTRRLLWITVLITILIAAIIAYLARRNLIVENERNRAQERLRDSMERYKKLVEASTDGVLMIIDNEIVYCNPFLLNLLGYTQSDFDQQDSQFYKTINDFLQLFSASIDKGQGVKQHEISMEQKILKKNGVLTDVVVNRSKFEIEGKQGFIFAVKDVSKHKDVERELDLSMEKFKSIAGLMSIGVFRCTLGRQSRFVEINQKAITLLGYYSESEVKDTRVQDLFEIEEEKNEVIKAINEGFTIKDRLLRLKRADGSIVPTLVSLFPVSDAHGKMVFCDGMLIDAYDHLGRGSNFSSNTSTINLSANVLLRPLKDFAQVAPYCTMHTKIFIASKILTSSKADLLIVNDETGVAVGLVTHSDISRRVVAAGIDLNSPISEIMSAPLISVSEDEMVMDAFTLMLQHRISYIVVKSLSNAKKHYISLLSLSELRKDTPEYLSNTIDKAQSVFEINETMLQLPRQIRNLLETGTGIASIAKFTSKLSDSVTAKFIDEAISELGKPPVPFVFLVLGSEGRKEQTLATDQDNAIVFQDMSHEVPNSHRQYFLTLGAIVCNRLCEVGFPLCKGGVMAMNSDWCMSLADWEARVAQWISTPNPQEVLNTSIFFDFRPVYGDFGVANRLQKFCQMRLKDQNVYFYNLAQTTISIKVNAIEGKENDSYDIKIPILAITSIARLWSLRYGIGERNTAERFLALKSIGIFTSSHRDEFDQAYRFLMNLRLKNQLQQIESNSVPDNKIPVQSFSDIDRIMIKKIVTIIADHQARIAIDFRVG